MIAKFNSMRLVTKKRGNRPKVVKSAKMAEKEEDKEEEEFLADSAIDQTLEDLSATYTDTFEELLQLANRVSGICVALVAKEKQQQDRLHSENSHAQVPYSQERQEEDVAVIAGHVEDLRLAQGLYAAATPHCESFSRKQVKKCVGICVCPILLDCVRIRTYETLPITKHDWLLHRHTNFVNGKLIFIWCCATVATEKA